MSAALLEYKLGPLYSRYENIVTEIHLPGENISFKNHSKEFSRNFLALKYVVLKNSVVSSVTEKKLSFRLLVEQMSASN